MKRRHFILTSGTAAVVAGAAGWLSTAAAAIRRPLGVQLFTVMNELEKDFDGTLKTLAQIGYREVETIGAHGRDPKLVRTAFDRAGLVSPSQHLMVGDLYQNFLRFTRREITAEDVGKVWDRDMAITRMQIIVAEAITRAKVLGQQYIVLQKIWPAQFQTRALLDKFCRALDLAGDMCAEAGLTFCFHNHDDEFATVDGVVPYQVILQSTNHKTVKMELDLYWAVRAKVDPAQLLKDNPGRYVQLHVKDSSPAGDFATVGKGVIDFPHLLSAAQRAGVKHYYVEYDLPDDSIGVVRQAYSYLRTQI
jgi:sugar phosphate isomerase/epimerase